MCYGVKMYFTVVFTIVISFIEIHTQHPSKALILANSHKPYLYFDYVSDDNILQNPHIIAMAVFKEEINTTGWSSLTVSTSSDFPDYLQAYWAGFLETNLTFSLTASQWANTVRDMCPLPLSKDCQALRKYLSENMAYMLNEAYKNDKHSSFWYHVALQLWQLKGMSDAFDKRFIKRADLLNRNYLDELVDNVMGIYLLQLNGDLGDLVSALSLPTLKEGCNQNGHPFIASSSCSALIKVVDSNVYLSHVTWSPYSIMLRVLKHYNFPWKIVNNTGSQKIPGFAITFSSYPTYTSSVDDFYITSANLTITETTNNVYNKTLWEIVRNGSKNAVLTFMRGMVASRLAKTGEEWITYFKYNNSGTYNNQWMIFDAKQWPKNKGSLLIAEQLPGIVSSLDVTKILKINGYWASYNLPFIGDIYTLSGTEEMAKMFGDWYVHNKTARAKIFRRDHHKVVDFPSMLSLMRYNDFMNDPLSTCPCKPPYTSNSAISARDELNDPKGQYPIPSWSYRLHGGTDAKIVDLSMINQLNMIAISGPTYDDLPPFRWSLIKDVKKPLMHPDKWQFPPVITDFIDYPKANSNISARFLSFESLF
ncbi:putative phospholipase B-like 2 isoform 3 [Schistosoma japonicum]|uniref:Phospholipase B-like n=6 Tax=Schistosoma japonicum TaxID=6182 RepID=C1LID8_SCHJA|nr:phospholipase B-like 2 [Schistosoma japonicum]TNN20839.1 putative phospholipase B-like 2 isoform 3 [Schistosoma japonicum]CAX74466.1 LAMA-like protein 2 precursor [Schistosoma japonicum]